MKQNVALTIASLLSILFVTFHLADDIVLGMEPGTLSNLVALPILVVRLYKVREALLAETYQVQSAIAR